MKNIFDKYTKENYEYEISNAVLSKEDSTLHLEVQLNFLVPYNVIPQIEDKIKEKLLGLKNVEFHFHYKDMVISEKEIIQNYVPYILGGIKSDFKAFTKTINLSITDWEKSPLILHAVGQKTISVLNEKVSPQLIYKLKEKFNIEREIIFVNDEKEYEEVKRHVEKETSKKPERIVVPKKEQSGSKKQVSKKALKGNVLLGKSIKISPTLMKEAIDVKEGVVLEGEVFKIEERTIKSGKKLVTFLFSDGSTSMASKFFISEEKWDQIKDILEKGVFLNVKGNIEWDSFSNSLVLMAKDIELKEKIVREDREEEKRVELHAHTKMSALDGLNDVGALVNQAIAWGHPAVAITDHGVAQAFPVGADIARNSKSDIKIIYGIEGYIFDDEDQISEGKEIDYKSKKTNHIILLAKNEVGLKNLYKLISLSHLEYFYRRPRLPKSILKSYREGLIIGSACEAGEIFQAIIKNAGDKELEKIIDLYDYLEIQPIANNHFMINKGIASNEEDLRNFNRKVVELGKKYNKPVVATTDSHYTSQEEGIYREILMAGQGYADFQGGKGLFFRTTREMLDEFEYLGQEKAREVVIYNTNKIADMIEKIAPVPTGKFPPTIKDSDKILRDTCEKNAEEKYGNPLPEKIRERLDKELNSIIGNDYAVMYVSAKLLVDKSMEDGFLVGSRGSVGSSFAATMSGITEVNPLPPHYICKECKHFQWGDENEFDCGVDMPEKICPDCGAVLDQDGFSIPFETFLGFEGDKEPDIDLNFAGEYQSEAHKYVDEIFGAKNVYRAGTISTVASKTAYGFVMKYFEQKDIPVNKYEVDRLTEACTGVRRTTGQHPGGIIIVPDDKDIYDFCPVQYPANDSRTNVITTHFDYHSIDKNLLKLDILGHDVPSMIKYLQDMTGVDPLTIPLKDEKVSKIFNGIEGLDIVDKNYKFKHGSYGIPEFGTRFVRQMLDDTKPEKFADLIRISGFSHGTNVWINNAQEFIRSGEATMREAISTRDDIMNYLILKGLPYKEAFNIMEKVRKGKGLTEEWEDLMREKDVPEWYIESCKRISYMFPRAHAVAYVMMSYRIAYYKVYYPVEFYAVLLTTKIADFNWGVIKKGGQSILERIDGILSKGRNATKKEDDEVTVLEIAYEMISRGYEFSSPTLEESEAMRFTVSNKKVLVPLCALEGVGETVGKAIEMEQKKKGFDTIEELQKRTKVNKTAIESLKNSGVLTGIPESNQISFF